MAYDFQVTIDCSSPHELADWWAAVLEWDVEPSDEAFIRRMIAEGHATEDATTTHKGVLVWKEGAAIRHPESRRRVLFQLVPEAKTVKNRVHVDVRIGGDVEAVVERITSTGGSFLHEGRQGPHTWSTVADPEGNEFCVTSSA